MGGIVAIVGVTAGAFSLFLPEWYIVRKKGLRNDVRTGEAIALAWSLTLAAIIAKQASANNVYGWWALTSGAMVAIYEYALIDSEGRENDDCGCHE